MEEFLQIAGLLFFSSIKFFLAPPASVIAGYGFWQTLLICFGGGGLGFIVFFKFGTLIQGFIKRLFKRKKVKKKKNFSKKNKLIIRAKLSFGLLGIALLTPCLLGIPLGAFLASNYYAKNPRVIPVFLSSIFLWSLGLTYFSLYIKLP